MPRPWRKILSSSLWLLPALNALYEGAVMAMAVSDLAEDDHSSQTAKFVMLLSITSFSFLQSLALNGKATVEGVKESAKILCAGERPSGPEWPDISSRKEKLALTLTAIITLGASAADFFTGFFFVDNIPEDYEFSEKVNLHGWRTFSLITGSIAAATTIFTEGVTFHKALRQSLSGDHRGFHNISQYCSVIVGNGVAILGGLENAVEAYASMKNILKPNGDAARYSILVLSSTKLFSDYNFSGAQCINGIEEFMDKLQSGLPTAKETLAFLLAAGSAVIVVWPQRSLTADLINDPKTSLPFNSPNALTQTLAFGVSIRDGIVQTRTLYPYFHKVLAGLQKKVSDCFQKCRKRILPSNSIQMIAAAEPLLDTTQDDVVLTINTHSPASAQGFFKRSNSANKSMSPSPVKSLQFP